MPTARDPLYQRHRFPPEVISHAVWLYFRFPLSLRMVEEMLATRGICVTYETVRQVGKEIWGPIYEYDLVHDHPLNFGLTLERLAIEDQDAKEKQTTRQHQTDDDHDRDDRF